MSDELAIQAEDLHVSYGSVDALRGVDLAAETGTVLGLLGPNGAGKTTAVRVLTTLLRPNSGSARVAGFDVVRERRRAPQPHRPRRAVRGRGREPDRLREPRDGGPALPPAAGRGRASGPSELLNSFELDEAAGRLVRTYSGGMRRRLDLAASLVAQPPVLFLDEPTTGLDPRSRNKLLETIERQVASGTTVLLTTQTLDEADRLADSIAVIDRGKVIAEGSPDELKARVGGERLEVTIEDASRSGQAVEALASTGCDPPEVDGPVVRMTFPRRSGVIADAVRELDDAGIGIADLVVRRPTLDDVFMVLTGHAAKEDEEAEERELEEART